MSRSNDAIRDLIARRTADLVAAGPEACRAHLVSLGIYNADGSLHEDFGGASKGDVPQAAGSTCI